MAPADELGSGQSGGGGRGGGALPAARYCDQELDRVAADRADAAGAGGGLLFKDAELDFLGNFAREYRQPAPDSLGRPSSWRRTSGGTEAGSATRAGTPTILKGYGKLATATVGHNVCSKWGGTRRVES